MERYSLTRSTVHWVSCGIVSVSSRAICSVVFLAIKAVMSWNSISETPTNTRRQYGGTHVVQQSADASSRLGLETRHSLASQKAPFFSGVPMKFNGSIKRDVTTFCQNSESFQNAHCAGPVVVGTWCWQQRGAPVDGILMSAHDCQWRRESLIGRLETSNDRRLGEDVREIVQRDVSLKWCPFYDLL